tara:strand:+ start:496 stop:615 length:120 start_codon:yes stop_codon:yes gene_type:complete
MVKYSKSKKYRPVAVRVKAHGRRVYVSKSKLTTKKRRKR